jgi:hypothetical protein
MLARLRPHLLLFLALTVAYHANLRPIDSGDTLPGSLLPFAILLDGAVTLDRFEPWLRVHVWYAPSVLQAAHRHYFSIYPIGGPLLVSPLYLPLAFFVRNWDTGSLVMLARVAGKFAATTVAALSAVWLLLLLQRITSAPWAWTLTLVYALATETWSISSQALWQHGPGELAVIGCLYGMQRWWDDRARNGWLWLCGACAAAALVIRPTNLILLLAVLAALLFAKAGIAQYTRLLPLPLAAGLLLASYNWYVFDRLSGSYMVPRIEGSTLPALAGLFFSPGRGFLIYTPVALFALFAFFPVARRKPNPLLVMATVFIALEWLVTSRWVLWWGGYCWGPRLLTELAPPLVVSMAMGVPAMENPALRAWPRRAFAIFALYSVLIQAIGVFFYPKGHWDAGPPSVDNAPSRLWDWRDNPIARTVRGGFYWEPYAIAGAAITGGLKAARARMQELNVDPYQQAQPIGDRGLR